MEIVVDSSVWIDEIKSRPSAAVSVLRRLLDEEAPVRATDVVCAELLAAPDRTLQAALVERLVASDAVLTLDGVEDMRVAADCMRASKRAGRTVRSMTDCLIAAVCIREGIPLLHDDRDFTTLAELTDLQVISFD